MITNDVKKLIYRNIIAFDLETVGQPARAGLNTDHLRTFSIDSHVVCFSKIGDSRNLIVNKGLERYTMTFDQDNSTYLKHVKEVLKDTYMASVRYFSINIAELILDKELKFTDYVLNQIKHYENVASAYSYELGNVTTFKECYKSFSDFRRLSEKLTTSMAYTLDSCTAGDRLKQLDAWIRVLFVSHELKGLLC